ncbi:MAG: MFS transporter [Erysipelothrix sp.]|nr:MFS transporter [Erysipelothrix sp.]
MNTLWNKNFTIITLGTVVSMLGNTVSSFALAVLILELTNSSFAFALYLALNNLPRLFVPMIAGTFLDRFSRVKVIYSLDFLSSFVFLFIFVGLTQNFLNYQLFMILALIIGTIDSIYQVAYDSLYPTFIDKGNFSKAYSISSMIYPIAALMTPVAAFIHETIGLEILFIFNSLAFFIAAVMETKMDKDESHIQEGAQQYKIKEFKKEYKQGLKYLITHKGLLFITLYFFCNSLFQMSVSQTLEMPYFKNVPSLGYQRFTFISTANVLGRFIGGFLHYRFELPSKYKFNIAMSVYVIISVLHAFYLYTPFTSMLIINFVIGILAVTSFNIRISSTQATVDNAMRGRFNGVFQTITTTGLIIGQVLWGALGEVFDARMLIMSMNLVTLVLTFIVIYRQREHVKPIYNQTL